MEQKQLLSNLQKYLILGLILCLVVVPLSAQAYWSTSKTLSLETLSAAKPAIPSSVKCADIEKLLIPAAKISWDGSPNAIGYEVWVSDGAAEEYLYKSVVDTTIEFEKGLLDGLVGGIVGLLGGKQPIHVFTVAKFEGGWSSQKSASVKIQNLPLSVIPLRVGGYGCLP